MPRKDNAKTQKQKIEEKKAKEQSKANKYNDRNKTKTNIYSTGGNKTTGGTTTKPTGTTTKPTSSSASKSSAYADGGDRGGKTIDKNPLASAMKPSTTPAPWVKKDTTPTMPSGNPIPTPKPSASAAAVGAVGGAVGGATKKPEPEAPGAGGAGGVAGAVGTTPDISGSIAGGAGGSGDVPGEKKADIPDFKSMLDQWLSAAKQQQEAAINYGVEQGVNELRRAEEDAQQQYQAQQDQINIDEARAKDNQALYAEARGDRGGIGAAQYDSIMNAAAQNRLTVSQQQTKLSTDTARQIADLRAQGEYKKADAVLELTQRYLTQLMSLEQWALNYQMDVAQFNLQLEKWQADYALSLAKLKGTSTGGTSSGSSGGSGGTYTGGSGGTSYGGSGGTSSGSSGVNPSAMTSAEVKEWQRKLGVTADGIWGPNTQAAYDKLMNPNKNQDPHIVNPSSTSSGWVAIPGHGRFSYQELKVLVDKGKVKETKKSDGTYAYTWVNK